MLKTMIGKIEFPEYSGLRCLMMPYVQGESNSVPQQFNPYAEIINSVYFKKGEIGFLTIDESPVTKGLPHRGARSKTSRALHTEAGRQPDKLYAWGGGGEWGGKPNVTLDGDVGILLSNNLNDSCAVWDAVYPNTSIDGDIGHVSHLFPYKTAIFLKAGEVHKIGILTPHESLPVRHNFNRQFLRIISSGVHGREPYFTKNPLMAQTLLMSSTRRIANERKIKLR